MSCLKPERLQQLVSPIALYADNLVAQLLIASTYPLEVVEASRWLTANRNLKGDALKNIYENDLGENALKIAAQINAFNPDDSWKKVTTETQ